MVGLEYDFFFLETYMVYNLIYTQLNDIGRFLFSL